METSNSTIVIPLTIPNAGSMCNNTQDGENIICPECARKKMIEEIEEQ